MVDDAPRILGGRYEVGELIGRGGMAEVHIGHDTRLGRTVAIKILRSDLARDPSFQARFRREAQAAAALNHPAIVAVYDTGEDVSVEPSGTVAHVPFIVMEYVEGHTVRDILRDGAAVPIEEAVEITAGVLSALEYSHHAGIVHRDIKPANVMLTPTGAVKVMDFGIARAMADAAGTMTQTQAVIGTAQYLSPEQARGEAVDSRSDLYSTGCLLFELLTGRPPFIGDSPVAVAYQHAREIAQPPSAFASDVPDALDRITMKALAKDRDQRYATAAEFRGDLEAAMRGGPINAPVVGAAGLAAGPAFGSGAPTQVIRPEPPAAATQVLGATPPTPPMPPAPVSAGWAPLGVDDAGRGAGPIGAPGQYRRDVDEDNRKPWLLWVLIGVAVIAIIGIIVLLTRGNPGGTPTPSPSTFTMPNVAGKTLDEVKDLLAPYDVEITPLSEASQDVPKDQATRSDPAADAPVAPGSEVKVYFSSGPTSVTVPTGMKNFTKQQVEKALRDAGFTGSINYQPVDDKDVAKDAFVSSEPAEGADLAPDGSITVYISSGKVQLTSLVGLTEQEARDALTALGLTPNPSFQETPGDPPGTVISQDPGASSVDQHSTVSIVIAQDPGPAKVEVPDVFNLTEEDAVKRVAQFSLNPKVEYVTPNKSTNGRAEGTNPSAGTEVEEGSTVTVYIAKDGTVPGGGGNP